MDIFTAIILGIVEGFTEFLPISSTGHLIVVSDFLGMRQDAVTKAFEVIIQFSAILAVVLVYREKFSPKKIELWKKVILAFLPIGIVGYIFRHEIKELFSVEVVAYMFIFGGLIFLVVEYFYKETNAHVGNVEAVSYKQAMWIGFSQIFALIPGMSRAGSTIIGGLLVGLDRKTSAEFSFLLALPVMSAVTGYDILKNYHEFTDANFLALGVGFVTAFLVAFLAIKLFLKFLENFTFVGFGIYRIVFGLWLLFLY